MPAMVESKHIKGCLCLISVGFFFLPLSFVFFIIIIMFIKPLYNASLVSDVEYRDSLIAYNTQCLS